MKSLSEAESILALLKKMRESGIRISLEAGQLSLRYSRGTKVDGGLLKEIEASKDHLKEYFAHSESEFSVDPFEKLKPDFGTDIVVHNDECYYPVSPVQVYWIRNEVDEERRKVNPFHGIITINYDVYGALEVSCFRNAVQYVVERHESLRSTFHLIDGKYLMKINDVSLLNSFEFRDGRGEPANSSAINEFIAFHNHVFDMEKGPLFIVRLVQTEATKFILYIKIHHIIFDSISRAVLTRDLLVAYQAIRENRKPELPVLKYQYKEYLLYINQNRERNYEVCKNYWRQLYTNVPPDLHILDSGRARSESTERIGKYETFLYPEALLRKLKEISGVSSVSLFEVLQTTVKLFFCDLSDQKDIAIGTFAFGRDYPGSENQVGSYAKTVLIRTVFDKADSFSGALQKVKRSNRDAKQYNACSLFEHLGTLLQPGQRIEDLFWKVNVQYFDNSYHDEGHQNVDLTGGLKYVENRRGPKPLVGVELTLQFFHWNGQLTFNIEFDSSQYSAEIVKKMAANYLDYTKRVTGNEVALFQ
jgi:NRPS condensation-like uncharacterized protein